MWLTSGVVCRGPCTLYVTLYTVLTSGVVNRGRPHSHTTHCMYWCAWQVVLSPGALYTLYVTLLTIHCTSNYKLYTKHFEQYNVLTRGVVCRGPLFKGRQTARHIGGRLFVLLLNCVSHYTQYITLYTVCHTINCISHYTHYVKLYTIYHTIYSMSLYTLYITLYTVCQTIHFTSHYKQYVTLYTVCHTVQLHCI